MTSVVSSSLLGKTDKFVNVELEPIGTAMEQAHLIQQVERSSAAQAYSARIKLY